MSVRVCDVFVVYIWYLGAHVVCISVWCVQKCVNGMWYMCVVCECDVRVCEWV